jgi:hypothetical protein
MPAALRLNGFASGPHASTAATRLASLGLTGLTLGWLWAKYNYLILSRLVALALALVFIDSTGLLGFGQVHFYFNVLIEKHLQESVGLEGKFPNSVVFRLF